MKKRKRTGKRAGIVLLLTAALVLGTGCTSKTGGEGISRAETEEKGLLEEIQSYKGYIRVVSQEEYEFYQYFVERDLSGEAADETLDEMVKAYINEANAVFYLGNKLGLYEPYSFDLLKLRMEQENRDRKEKLEAGETVYGLESFTLQTYYQYERSNLETDLVEYIETHMDQEILDLAEAYYNENAGAFVGRETITYESAENGKTTEVVADRDQLNFLAKADMNLADFLENANVGDTYSDSSNGITREIVVTEVVMTKTGFEYNQETVVPYYIQSVLLEELIQTVAENNPVEFAQ